MNFTYDPEEFSITMDMFFNNENVYTNTLSGKEAKLSIASSKTLLCICETRLKRFGDYSSVTINQSLVDNFLSPYLKGSFWLLEDVAAHLLILFNTCPS